MWKEIWKELAIKERVADSWYMCDLYTRAGLFERRLTLAQG